MRTTKPETFPRQPRDAEELVAEIARSTTDVTEHSAAALGRVCCDIIVGEGPTVAGRIHFSRTIDADDASLCARILCVAGRAGLSVSRVEADALFEIDAAGSERCDDGRFDDLLAKAVLHHLMGAAGAAIPSRGHALARENPLAAWGSAIALAGEPRSWLAAHLDRMKPLSGAAHAIDAVLHVNPARPRLPLGILFDTAA